MHREKCENVMDVSRNNSYKYGLPPICPCFYSSILFNTTKLVLDNG